MRPPRAPLRSHLFVPGTLSAVGAAGNWHCPRRVDSRREETKHRGRQLAPQPGPETSGAGTIVGRSSEAEPAAGRGVPRELGRGDRPWPSLSPRVWGGSRVCSLPLSPSECRRGRRQGEREHPSSGNFRPWPRRTVAGSAVRDLGGVSRVAGAARRGHAGALRTSVKRGELSPELLTLLHWKGRGRED